MDLEMTGLDVTSDTIVEIATLITDDDLNVIAEGPNLVISAPEDRLAAMNEVVVEMHTASGLLERIRQSTIELEEATEQTLAFLKSHIGTPRTVPLCGNSIGTDRRFLDRYMPEVENFLHYRSIDVSSIKELARRWYPRQFSAVPRKQTAHRAMDDILESLEELRYWRGALFIDPAQAAVRASDGSPEPAEQP
jgi:oligoribonuclease